MVLIMLEYNSFGRWYAVAKLIKPEMLSNAIGEILQEFEVKTEERANNIIRRAAIKIWSSIIKLTPVDTGRARGNWQIDTNVNNKILESDENGVNVDSEMPKNIFKKNVKLFNNLPYINTLEFGGYPKNPKTGNKTVGGYSKQAKQGMVRKSLLRWKAELKKAAKAIK